MAVREVVPEVRRSNRVQSWRWAAIGALLFALAIGFGVAARSFGPLSPELGVDAAMVPERQPALTALAMAVNVLLSPWGAVVLVALICVWLLLQHRLVDAVAFGLITAVIWGSSAVGKVIVARLRPPAEAVHPLVAETQPDSFPSGHTAFAFALSVAAFLILARRVDQRWLVAAAGVVFTVAVGLTRIYLGVHYPTDVIGSVLIGSAALLMLLPIWNRVAPRLAQQVNRRVGSPGLR